MSQALSFSEKRSTSGTTCVRKQPKKAKMNVDRTLVKTVPKAIMDRLTPQCTPFKTVPE